MARLRYRSSWHRVVFAIRKLHTSQQYDVFLRSQHVQCAEGQRPAMPVLWGAGDRRQTLLSFPRHNMRYLHGGDAHVQGLQVVVHSVHCEGVQNVHLTVPGASVPLLQPQLQLPGDEGHRGVLLGLSDGGGPGEHAQGGGLQQ